MRILLLLPLLSSFLKSDHIRSTGVDREYEEIGTDLAVVSSTETLEEILFFGVGLLSPFSILELVKREELVGVVVFLSISDGDFSETDR